VEHIFFDNISKAARQLIEKENGIEIVMSFDSFLRKIVNQDFQNSIDPFVKILNDFTIKEKPIFWI